MEIIESKKSKLSLKKIVVAIIVTIFLYIDYFTFTNFFVVKIEELTKFQILIYKFSGIIFFITYCIGVICMSIFITKILYRKQNTNNNNHTNNNDIYRPNLTGA
jgi:hypothetical protein